MRSIAQFKTDLHILVPKALRFFWSRGRRNEEFWSQLIPDVRKSRTLGNACALFSNLLILRVESVDGSFRRALSTLLLFQTRCPRYFSCSAWYWECKEVSQGCRCSNSTICHTSENSILAAFIQGNGARGRWNNWPVCSTTAAESSAVRLWRLNVHVCTSISRIFKTFFGTRLMHIYLSPTCLPKWSKRFTF